MTGSMSGAPDLERRFGGVGRVYGKGALERFREARVCVVGVGGVGSWVVEAFARSAVGHLTLIDLDMIAESNVNRQLHAFSGEFGKAKVLAMTERVAAINPSCTVVAIEDFVTPENIEELLGARYDYVVDAIDQVRVKAALIAWCRRQGVPVLTSGGAGGQIDPARIEVADLARTTQDPLLSRVRSLLRKEYGFSREAKKKFGVAAVYSTEPLRYPQPDAACETLSRPGGLNCGGFGSSVCITATFGFVAAGEVLKHLATAICPD